MKRSRLNSLLRGDSGQNLVEAALVLPFLVLLLAGAVDLGRAYYVYVELKAAAHAGALYGSQYPGDTNGITAAATSNAKDLSSDATFKVTPISTGCECSDGTTVTPGCSNPLPSCGGSSLVNYVSVTTSITYKPLLPWPGIPSTMPLSETVEMRSGL